MGEAPPWVEGDPLCVLFREEEASIGDGTALIVTLCGRIAAINEEEGMIAVSDLGMVRQAGLRGESGQFNGLWFPMRKVFNDDGFTTPEVFAFDAVEIYEEE